MEKIIVIGTNHAGTHAITTILENYKDNYNVTTYDKNDNISFLGCGMALWIGNQITSSEGLFYATPQSLKDMGANVFMEHELVNVDFDNKKVYVKDINTDVFIEDTYDKLIFALGSWPILPKIKGYDLDNIVYAKIFQNAQNVIEKLKNENIKRVAVVGAGYIGVELAEAFKQNGKEVLLVNDGNVLNRYYDESFQEKMHKNLEAYGIQCKIGEKVTEFVGTDNKVTAIKTTKGTYDVDMVLMSVGFKPNTELLHDKAIELTKDGSIKTNENCQTSIEDVYAIGDCATIYNNAAQEYMNISLATNAVRTGIVAGHNVAGKKLKMQGVQGSNAIHIFGLTMSSTGMTEAVAIEKGFDVETVTVSELIRPEFMPNNNYVNLKIVWDKKSLRILGAQICSKEDVSVAIHTFSLAIQEQYTIDKLALLDLFFLPHFNQPKNFITKAGLEALKKI